MTPDESPTPESESQRGALPHNSRLRRIAIGIVMLFGGALVGLVLSIYLFRKNPPPLFTPQEFAAAQARWEAAAIRDYDLELEVEGGQHGKYRVTVRGGAPTAVLRNDQPVPERTWHYWTVPGLFKIMAEDQAGLDDPQRVFQAPPGAKVVLQAEFDSQLGYPARYRRAVLETGNETSWQVTRFAEIP